MREAYALLSHIIDTEGPFDGILGFSHGATLAFGFLVQHAREHPYEAMPVRCAVSFSGMPPFRLGEKDDDDGEDRWVYDHEGQGPEQGEIFSHFRRITSSPGHTADERTQTEQPIQDQLRKVKSLKKASQQICESIIAKVSSLLMTPLKNISKTKPMSEYDMNSLVAVEMRNWLFKERDTIIPI